MRWRNEWRTKGIVDTTLPSSPTHAGKAAETDQNDEPRTVRCAINERRPVADHLPALNRVKQPTPSSILIGFPHARYHPAWELITWHPQGVLDDALLDRIAAFIEIQEQVVTAPPFNRFADLSGLTDIRVRIGHVFEVAERRRQDRFGMKPVKSAFYCDKIVGFGIARMYEALMEGSSVEVRAFRERAAAAEWLEVPGEVLSAATAQ
jgi:hypothetical protein